MSDTSSKHTVNVDSSAAEADIDRLQRKADKLQSTLEKVAVLGGGVGGGGGGGRRRTEEEKAETQRVRDEKAKQKLEEKQAAKEAAEEEARQKATKQRKEAAWQGIKRTTNTTGLLMGAGAVTAYGGALGGSPGAVVGGLGLAASSAISGAGSLAKDFGKLAGGAGGSIIGMFGALGEAMGKAFGIAASALTVSASSRYNVANQIADFQRAGLYAPLTGTSPGYGAGAALGMMPTEAAGAASSAALAAGYQGARLSSGTLFSRMAYGASPGTIGALAGTAAYAGGSAGGTREIFNAAASDGLIGGKLDAAIMRIVGAIENVAFQGILTNTSMTGQLTYGMSGAVRGLAAPGAAHNTVSNLIGLPAGVKQQLLSPFNQAAQGLVLAQAAKSSKGGGFDGLLAALETMGPAGALDALRSSPSIGRRYLAQTMPMGTGAADAALNAGMGRGGIEGFGGTSVGAAASGRVRTAAGVMGTMDPEMAAKMIASMGALQISIQSLAGNVDEWGPKLMDFLTSVVNRFFPKAEH